MYIIKITEDHVGQVAQVVVGLEGLQYYTQACLQWSTQIFSCDKNKRKWTSCVVRMIQLGLVLRIA